jgi:hypothetical protein
MNMGRSATTLRAWRPWQLILGVAACGGSGDTSPSNANTPAAIVAVSVTSQLGAKGSAVSAPPSVKVTSTSGAGVGGVTVVFAVSLGGGSVTGATQTTNGSGVATVGGWTLGPAPGTNLLTATVAGLTAVTFAATATLSQNFTVSPVIAATAPRTTTTFTAKDASGAPASVVWRVNGVAGGSPQAGLIAAGAYTAPSTIPDGDSVVVTAATLDNGFQQSATVYFVPDSTTSDYYVPIPRVVDLARATRTRFLVVPPPNTATVSFIPISGAAVPLTPMGRGAVTFTLDASAVTSAYVPGTLHYFVGRLDYRTSTNAQIKLANLNLNVRDAGMPDVPVTSLAADAQRTPYVLNLRADTATVGPYASIVARTLQLLGGDKVDFVAVIATVSSNNNRFFAGVRNDVRGIGLATYDNSGAWGGTGRLRGAIAFPLDYFFDGAEQGFIHEHGHAWINYATDPILGAGSPHWPLSTMAHGIMGFSIGGAGGEGGPFPWLLTPLGDGTVRVSAEPPPVAFTPMDLYLMGLLSPDSVSSNLILPPSTNVNSLAAGQILPATTYTINDYIAGMGSRVPSTTTSPKQFATACVVLSYGRLLTQSEMAFFDYASARAETRTPLTAVSGLATTTAPGFFLATGGRATLTTRLP